MSRYKIKDLAIEISERVDNPKNSGYEKFVGLEHYDSGVVTITRYGSTEKLESSMKKFISGDILIARRNVYLKRAGLVNFEGLTSGDSIVLRAKNNTFLRLLPFIFNTKKFWDYATKFADGSMSKRLSPKILMEYEVDLPDNVEEMIKLADVLWSASETLYLYRKLISQSNDVLNAKFIELFGEVKEHVHLSECCSIHARIGWQALTKKEHLKTGEYMLVTGTDFIDGKVNYDTCVFVDKNRYDMDDHIKLLNGDILITKDGTIGKVAIVDNLPGPATLNSGIFVLRPNNSFNSTYISYVFRGPLFEKFVAKATTGATIKHLNQEKLLKFRIPVPTNELQEQFELFYKEVENAKILLKSSFEELSCLYKKLLENKLTIKED